MRISRMLKMTPQRRSQSRASLRRTARVRLSRPAPCGLADHLFRQPWLAITSCAISTAFLILAVTSLDQYRGKKHLAIHH